MTRQDEQIKLNLDNLDFGMIHRVMVAENITWRDSKLNKRRVPTINEIKVMAKHCMERAFDVEEGVFCMGGFEAELINGTMTIKFIIDKSDGLSPILKGS